MLLLDTISRSTLDQWHCSTSMGSFREEAVDLIHYRDCGDVRDSVVASNGCRRLRCRSMAPAVFMKYLLAQKGCLETSVL